MMCAALAAAALAGCDAPHFYPHAAGDPTVPRSAENVTVTTSPLRFVREIERAHVTVVRLHPVSRGTLPAAAPFPIVVERIAPDGTARSFSTQHAFDVYGSPVWFFGARDGSTWFEPQTTVTHSYGSGPSDEGEELVVTGDGTAWISYTDGRLASVASDGTTSFYQSPAAVVSRIVAGSGGSILIFDDPTHAVYRIDRDRSCWYVGRFPQFDPMRNLPEQPTDRDAMWFGDANGVSAIAGDGSMLRTVSTRVPTAEMLAGDGSGVWTLSRKAYGRALPSYDAVLSHDALDGTVAHFVVAESIALRATIAPNGDLLMEAAAPGSAETSADRHFFAIDTMGRGMETILELAKTQANGNELSERPDGALLVGWEDRSFATIDRHGAVSITDMPRP